MSTIKVSVIIPVYNSSLYLKQCLDSIINQTLQEIEIIVVNDGSTDTSLEILQQYASKDSRITIINQKNVGTGASRNNAIEKANGHYISFVDSDDYIQKEMLQSMYIKASHKKNDIVIARYRRVDSKENILSESQILEGLSKEEIFIKLLNFSLPSVSCNALYKSTLFEQKECFYPSQKIYNEDTATIYKLYYFAKSITILNEIYYNWHDTSSSKTNSISIKHLQDISIVLDSIKDFLLKHNVYAKYKQEFLEAVFRSISKKYYQIKKFETNQDKQSQLIHYLLDSFYSKNSFESLASVLKFKDLKPSIYYTTLYQILKFSQNHIILKFFEPKDIQKLKLILENKFELLQFIFDYIDIKKVKNTYIYGVGETLQKILPEFIKKDINIISLIDKNITKVKSYKVNNLKNTSIEKNSNIVVSSISFADEITKELEEYSKKNDLNLNIINFYSILE